MKDKIKAIITITLIVLAVLLLFSQKPGFMAYGHCGEVHPNSQVCYCEENEDRIETQNGFVCESNQEVN